MPKRNAEPVLSSVALMTRCGCAGRSLSDAPLNSKIVEGRFQQGRTAREAMQRRSDRRTARNAPQATGGVTQAHAILTNILINGDAERDDSDHDEGGDDLDAEHAEQLAAHRRRKSLRQQCADFCLERGEVAPGCAWK